MAMLGFSVTALFVRYQWLTSSLSEAPHVARDSTIMIFFVVLCPPSLLYAFVTDAEVGTSAFYFVWIFIAILNAALYWTVSAIISRRKKSLDSN